MAEKQVLKLKLCDEEKSKLIDFFKVNKALWSSSTSFRDKEEKVNVKKALVDLFDREFTETFLEKQFHALRTAFNRESKKYREKEPKKKWKFFEQLKFLQDEIEKEKRVPFDVEERETLIDFYNSHPTLWNHHLAEYRDRNLRDSLYVKLLELFDDKFCREDITQEWHNLITIYKREKKREEGSTSSGSGSNELYVSKWEHFTSMEFFDVTEDVDDSITSLDSEVTMNCPPKRVKRQGKKMQTEDNDAKTELWKSISASLKQQPAEQKNEKSERAELFGKVVADSLLQYDLTEWSYLKKKVMDVFYDFDQQKLSNRRLNVQSPTFQPQSLPAQTWTNMLNNSQANFDPYSPTSVSSGGF